MARHLDADKALVLTCGKGILVLGGNGAEIGNLALQVMIIRKIQNIKKNCWNSASLSRDALYGSWKIGIPCARIRNRPILRGNSDAGLRRRSRRRSALTM